MNETKQFRTIESVTAEPTRPRVTGEREREILDATLSTLREVGYDRLTMDAVATAARASKATLYRRWENKAALVLDALLLDRHEELEPEDTGSLRTDLIRFGSRALTGPKPVATLAAVVTAVQCDPGFAAAFRQHFLGPKVRAMHLIYDRARERGELRDDVDLHVLGPAMAGIVLHRTFLMGETPTEELITRVVDQIIVPAACR